MITNPQLRDKIIHNLKANKEDVQKKELISALIDGKNKLVSLVDSIPESLSSYSYKKGKWSIKQVLMHLIDSERVHGYRAFRIARHDQTPLFDFNPNAYADHYKKAGLSLEEIKDEFVATRDATIQLFKNLSIQDLNNQISGQGANHTPRIIGWTIVAHEMHHIFMLRGKYLSSNNQ